MKIVFVTNFYNHHQAALAEAMYKLTGGQYTFIQTSQMSEERRALGWGTESLPAYVKIIDGKESNREYQKLIYEADVVIVGGGSKVESLVFRRIKSGKLVFRYAERVYRNAQKEKQKLLRGIKYHLCNFPYKNVYLLAASAYAAADYAKTGNFIGKAYKWGYFPEQKIYPSFDALMAQKEPKTILWVARLIELKHPELCLEIAERLVTEGYDFRLKMVGIGPMEQLLKEQIAEKGLTDRVNLLGAMKPEQVRDHMDRAGIFLFTSDFNEGWGAVLNESMNSGCAVIASHAIGSAPYLVQDGVNGYLYKNGDTDDLYYKIRKLLDVPEKAAEMSANAYNTMTNTWNPQTAAKRLIELAERMLSGEKSPDVFESGPCSKAELLDNDWYEPIYS